MIYAVLIMEKLRRVVLAEKHTLEDALVCVKKAYQDGRIVLDADDVVQDVSTRGNAVIEHADWEEAEVLLKAGKEVFT